MYNSVFAIKMTAFVIIPLFLFSPYSSVYAQVKPGTLKKPSALGGSEVKPRPNQVFPKNLDCRPAPNPNLGDVCVTTKSPSFGYSQKIVFLIPRGLTQPEGYVLHIHGWRGVCESNDISAYNFASLYRLFDQLIEAGLSNRILVFPVSVGRNDTHKNQLAPKFKAFTKWVEGLYPSSTNQWIISGHSGAYSPIGTILGGSDGDTLRKIESIGLIDATYSSSTVPHLVRATRQSQNPRMKIYSTYIPNSPTAGVSLSILKDQRLGNKSVVKTSGGNHCGAPKRDLANFYRFTKSISTKR